MADENTILFLLPLLHQKENKIINVKSHTMETWNYNYMILYQKNNKNAIISIRIWKIAFGLNGVPILYMFDCQPSAKLRIVSKNIANTSET